MATRDHTRDHLALVCRYCDACRAGDADGVAATVTEDVVHYFLAPNLANMPVAGGEHLGALPKRGFYVSCFPVKIARAGAGWCRPVAIFGL